MRHSMTGYASGQGEAMGLSWTWEMRSVNARGLDLRFRVPDWIEGLEAVLRKAVSTAVSRGNVTVSLRVQSSGGETALALNDAQLDRVLDALIRVEDAAQSKGLSLSTPNAADIVALRGVLDTPNNEVDGKEICKVLERDFAPVLQSFLDMRAGEGTELLRVLNDQVDRVEALVTDADALAEARTSDQADRLRASLARVVENVDGIDETRIAQELAVIAVKADVTEELDRLRAHIMAARDLLDAKAAVGRKLDFLMQEFNREANTLCSKAQFGDLTKIGLELKTVIDQMREQVQNVE